MEYKELENLDLDELTSEDNEQSDFIIKDATMANWAINKVVEEQKRFGLYEEVAKAEMQRIKEELAEEKRKSEARTSFLKIKLGDYLEREDVPAKTTKTQKTLTLPAGTIKKKLPHMEYCAIDADKPNNSPQLIELLQDIAPVFIKTETSVNWGEFKKELSFDENRTVIYNPTGEIIECMSLNYVPAEVKID